MLTKENQGKKNEGHLVVRLPVVMRLAECSIRFLMAAVLAGAEMFGGFAMCGVAMVGASGPGTEGFAALLGAWRWALPFGMCPSAAAAGLFRRPPR